MEIREIKKRVIQSLPAKTIILFPTDEHNPEFRTSKKKYWQKKVPKQFSHAN